MGWQVLPDSATVQPTDTLRIDIVGGYFEVGVAEDKLRQYLSDYTMLSILSVKRVLFWGYDVRAVPTGPLTVGQIRESVTFALTMLRDEWLVVAPGMSVDKISVQKGIDFEVPTTTAISLAAIAIVVVVGFTIWRQYK